MFLVRCFHQYRRQRSEARADDQLARNWFYSTPVSAVMQREVVYLPSQGLRLDELGQHSRDTERDDALN